MKILISITLVLLFSAYSHSQSLKNIPNGKTLYSSFSESSLDSIIKNNPKPGKTVKSGDYLTFSTGFFVATKKVTRNKAVPFISLDLNINLGSVIYLNPGVYGIFFDKESYLGLHGALGAGFDIIHNKLFTFAGCGAMIIFPFVLTEFVTLRVNYKFTERLSAGLDNKLIDFLETKNSISYQYIIGLNFSYRFNY